jgi:microcystin degradation protein MlrC
LLEALSQHHWPRPVLVPLVDPDLIQQATQAGVGSRLTVRIGGKRDQRFGKTILWEAEVERLFPAKFVMSGHIGTDLPIDMGDSAVLRQGDVHLLVTPRSGPHFAPEFFRSGGFEPYAAAVVVAKSPCGFRAVYQKQATAIYSVRAPGCAPTEFWKYPFVNIPHPLWPWDEF